MKKFVLMTAVTATVVAGAALPIQAKTKNSTIEATNNKAYVISGQCVNLDTITKFTFSDFGINFKDGIWNHCPVIVLPGICQPGPDAGTSGENQPDVNIPETETSGGSESQTTKPDNNENETESSGGNSAGNQGNTSTDNTNTGNTNVGNTGLGSTNAGNGNGGNTNTGNSNTGNTNTGNSNAGNSNTGNTDCNRPGLTFPNIQIKFPGKPGCNETETTTPETTVPETSKPDTSKPGSGGSSSGDSNQGTAQLSYAEQVVKLVNQERVKAGLKELTLDKNIESAALIRAKETEQSFSHTRPNGSNFSTVLTQQGISFRGAGENIAWGQSSPEAVMKAWMNSEGHRANILNAKFTKIGVGYYQNASGRKYWTQLFTY